MKNFSISKQSGQGNSELFIINFETPTASGREQLRSQVEFNRSSHTVTLRHLIGPGKDQGSFTVPITLVPLLRLIFEEAV